MIRIFCVHHNVAHDIILCCRHLFLGHFCYSSGFVLPSAVFLLWVILVSLPRSLYNQKDKDVSILCADNCFGFCQNWLFHEVWFGKVVDKLKYDCFFTEFMEICLDCLKHKFF